jgi:hypothetical protein
MAMAAKPPLAVNAAVALIALGGVYAMIWAFTPYTAGKLLYGVVATGVVGFLAYRLWRRSAQFFGISVLFGAVTAFAGLVQISRTPIYGASLLVYGLVLVALLLGPRAVREWVRPAKGPGDGGVSGA